MFTLNLSLDLKDPTKFDTEIATHTDKLVNANSILVQVFSGILEKSLIEKHLQFLQPKLPPNAVIIGCTTGGEILNGRMCDQSFIVSISFFEKTRLNIAAFRKDHSSIELGKSLAQSVVNEKTKAVLLFADGLLVNGEDLLKGFSEGLPENLPQIPLIAGGMSGDNSEFKQTWLISDTQVFDCGVVGVALNSDVLKVQNGLNLSWEGLGPKMKVTESLGSHVLSIDNQTPLSIYQDFLGLKNTDDVRNFSIDFPMVVEDQGMPIARGIIQLHDDETITYSGNLDQGSIIRFGVANIQSLKHSTMQMLQALRDFSPQSCFIYSCIGRKSYWKDKLILELDALQSVAPSAGFYTYGEFFQFNDANLAINDNKFLNITTTVLYLSEELEKQTPKTAELEKIDQQLLSENSDFLNALLNLVHTTSERLDKELLQQTRSNKTLNEFQDAINKTFIVSKTDIHGNIKEVNDNFVKISGFSRAGLLGQNHRIVRHPNTPPEVFENMWQTISNKKTWQGTLKNRKKTGGFYVVKTTIIPILDLNGDIVEYLSLREDVTLLHKQQTQIENEQATIKTLFNNQQSLVVMTDLSQIKLDTVNQAFLEFTHFPSLKDFLKEYDCICDIFVNEPGYLQKRMGHLSWAEYALANPSQEHRVKMLDQHGKPHIFSVRVSEIENQPGKAISNFLDISELEFERMRAIEAEEAKGRFLASMSHELRTPINGILGFSNLLQATPLNKEQSRFVELLINSSERLLGVVNDILDFSKMEQGELLIAPEPENIFVDLDHSLTTFMPVAQNKGVLFEIHLSPQLPECMIYDSLRINQILTNLVSNAVKFTPPAGKVQVDVYCLKLENEIATITFKVSDTGIGIPKDKLNLVFESFKQVSDKTAKQFGGTGLGLSIPLCQDSCRLVF